MQLCTRETTDQCKYTRAKVFFAAQSAVNTPITQSILYVPAAIHLCCSFVTGYAWLDSTSPCDVLTSVLLSPKFRYLRTV
ncbi:hypothetical protein K440DRAFT_627520 [Wilcoxina mikolae CBS 423.85]|nr:hypothetical protein K440DRAFT_627520 [Wilcoxina mikolae CBS 423.85]